MACSTCKDVILLDSDDSGLMFTTTAVRVIGSDGQSYPIQASLIASPHQPRNGWKLEFDINGQRNTVNGSHPKVVVGEAIRLFRLNGTEPSLLNLWFNANIQWLGRAVEKYQRVHLHQLLELADAHAPSEQGLHGIQRYPVGEWGEKAMDVVSLYLTGTRYDFTKFLGLVEELRTWMNPAENPLMGSSDYYMKMSLRLSELRKLPLYEQGEARSWLIETQKYLGFKTDNKW